MWLFLILVTVLALLALGLLASKRSITVKWYEWLIGGVAVFLLIFAGVEYFAAQTEFELRAANYILLIFGLSAIFLATVAAALVWRRNRQIAST